MEAIQGEGGIFPLDKDFVQEVFKICKEKDILIIFDEIQCGLARSGKLYAFNYFDVNADIITLAKGLGGGLPIGAVLCNDKLANTFNPGDHGSTFGGNPVSCAAALTVLNEIANDDFYKAVENKGNLIKSTILNAKLDKVVDVRGYGLMIGIEVKDTTPSIVQEEAIKNGLLVLTAGKNVVRLLPPLNISEKDLADGLNILIKSLS